MSDDNQTVHKAEIRELIEEWRDFGTGNVEWSDYGRGAHECAKACANELEELIDE